MTKKVLNKSEIQKRLKEKGWTQRRIANALLIDETSVSKVISGETKSERILNLIRLILHEDIKIESNISKKIAKSSITNK